MKWSSLDGRCGMDFTRKQRPEDELPESYKEWERNCNAFREEHRRQREHREERQRERKSRWFEDFFFNEGPREFPVAEEEVSHDPFKVLGLKRSASDEDIKTKYRELILIHHPDKSGGDHAEFIRIQAAYQTLK